MITELYKINEILKSPIEKIIIEERTKQNEDLEKFRPIESLRTSFELESFIFVQRSSLIHHRLFQNIIIQLYEQPYEQQPYEQPPYNIIETDYKKLKSILNMFKQEGQPETLLTYPTLELETLERLYTLRKRPEVIKFLADNSFLFPLLHEVYEKIRDYFGESVEVVLEVFTDPEVEMHQELGVFIRTNLSPNEAITCLEQFDDKWWLDAPPNARKKLCIDVEFI